MSGAPQVSPAAWAATSANRRSHSPFAALRRPTVSSFERFAYPARSSASSTHGGASRQTTSAPTNSLIPAFFAATCARTTPASVFTSVTARAAYPSAAAVSTSSSGWLAPSKNVKFDRQRSSA